MWVTKLLISPVKKRIFCPKTTKFGPKLAVLVNLGQAMQAYSMPSWWVGWWLWRAGCISQDTYLLYIVNFNLLIVWSEKSSEILSVCSILVEGRLLAKNYVFMDECLYIQRSQPFLIFGKSFGGGGGWVLMTSSIEKISHSPPPIALCCYSCNQRVKTL